MSHLDLVTWLIIGICLGACVGAWLAARRVRRQAHRTLAFHLREWRARHRAALDEVERQALLVDRTFAAVHLALIHVDSEMRIRAANPTACDWFDLDPAAWPTLMAAARSAELRDSVEAALHDEAGPGPAARVVIGQRVCLVNVNPLPDGSVLLALRDDTDVEQLSRARRDLVANISHDLRTPLTAIGLLVEALLGEAGTNDDERTALLSRLQQQVGALTEMADGLMELNRLESGRSILQLKPERLSILVQQASAGLWEQLDDKSIRIVADAPEDLWVLVDAPQLRRALGNLLDNATRFSPADGEIRVAAARSPDGEMIEVSVSDDGPGIAPGDSERVFERFYRGDPARSGPGKGLGLAIARHVVEGHGGRMWIDQTVARGTTVRFSLLAASEPPPGT